MSDEKDGFALARARILAELSPVAPPAETIAAIQEIASEHGLGRTDVSRLIDGFIDHHGLDPDAPAPVAILRAGYQVATEGDDGELVEELLNGMVGESMAALEDAPPQDWGEWFPRFFAELTEEVDHVARTVHPVSQQLLLRELLLRAAVARADGLILEAFPHLKAGPELIAEFVADLKQGAVLVLGKDTGAGLDVLRRVSDILERRHALRALMLKDQEDHEDLGLVGKLLVNAAAARWVLVENSAPSGHLYELPFVDMTGAVVVFLQREGGGSSAMPDEAILKGAQSRTFPYVDDTLESVIAEAVEWAESTVNEVRGAHAEARSWRSARPDDSA